MTLLTRYIWRHRCRYRRWHVYNYIHQHTPLRAWPTSEIFDNLTLPIHVDTQVQVHGRLHVDPAACCISRSVAVSYAATYIHICIYDCAPNRMPALVATVTSSLMSTHAHVNIRLHPAAGASFMPTSTQTTRMHPWPSSLRVDACVDVHGRLHPADGANVMPTWTPLQVRSPTYTPVLATCLTHTTALASTLNTRSMTQMSMVMAVDLPLRSTCCRPHHTCRIKYDSDNRTQRNQWCTNLFAYVCTIEATNEVFSSPTQSQRRR